MTSRTATNPSTDAVALRAELRDLYDDYGADLDGGRLDVWPDYFTRDAEYHVIARESFEQGLTHATILCQGLAMIRDRATAIRDLAVHQPRTLRHFISGVRVQSVGERVEAGANFLITEALYDDEPHLLMVGEYLDELVCEAGVWKFARRVAVYDNYRIRTSLVMPV
ncbi:MAG: nuclear transport factor 2 family protein [Sphingomonadales bacterium]